MIVCMYRMYRKYDKDKKNPIIKLKHASPSPFGISWKVARRPVRFSFFLLGKGRLSKLLTRRIGTFGS